MSQSASSILKNQVFEDFCVEFPDDRIIQITLKRPQKLNAIKLSTSHQIATVWELFDNDESLRVGIITGSGRAFCVGADLDEWNTMNKAGTTNSMRAPGLAGLPRRSGKKPIIAAVNGITMGGGFEMVANCDIVVASEHAIFALPEAKRGIVAVAGSIPRLTRTLGLQRTMDLVLSGRSVPASTLESWGLITRVVPSSESVVAAAIQVAREMCAVSPDALIVGRLAVRLSWERGSVEDSVDEVAKLWYPRLMAGPNFAEGIRAFVEKRQPKWIDSKL